MKTRIRIRKSPSVAGSHYHQNSGPAVPHRIYRIWPGYIRSPRAYGSWEGWGVIDIPAVMATDSTDLRSRERACSQAHANALHQFLRTDSTHCIVIEDDVTLFNRDWLGFTEFDYFQPFTNNRDERPGTQFTIRYNVLPLWGTQAYIASRRFAAAYIPLLEAGGIADDVNLHACIGLRGASYSSNGVLHDNGAVSTISEERRLAYLASAAGAGDRSFARACAYKKVVPASA